MLLVNDIEWAWTNEKRTQGKKNIGRIKKFSKMEYSFFYEKYLLQVIYIFWTLSRLRRMMLLITY